MQPVGGWFAWWRHSLGCPLLNEGVYLGQIPDRDAITELERLGELPFANPAPNCGWADWQFAGAVLCACQLINPDNL